MSIEIERQGPVTTVVLDRPEARNAVDRATAAALAAAFIEFDRDASAHVAVLCGANGTFCAGADLKAIAAGEGNLVAEPLEGADPNAPMGPTRLLLGKPVIAAIAGHAVAGGLELALWCDLRIAEEDAVLGVFSRRFGVPLIDGGTVRLTRLIGMGRALDLILTGRAVSAAEALAIGLVNRVVAKGEARAAAEALAHELAGLPQHCLRSDRLSAYEQWGMPLRQALAREFDLGAATLATGETAAGAAAFAAGKGRGGRSD
jgi:enoyl-CoA hydratase